MKKSIAIIFLFLASFSLAKDIKPIMVYDTKVILDKSWNEAIHKGILKFEKKTNINVEEEILIDITVFKKQVSTYAQNGFNPIMLNNVDDAKTEALKKIMSEYPKARFIIFNGTFNIPNAQYFVFSNQESSFVAGYLASKKSQTKKLGFIGGMDIPLIKNFLCGYIKGAKHANPKTEVLYDFIATDFSAWSNPEKAYTLATAQINDGADVIFGPAGGSSLGVHKAANEKNVYSIGVDSNQNNLYPGTVLTSTMVRVDNAAFRALMAMQKNIWGEMKVMGFQENGVALAFDEHNEALVSHELRNELNNLKADIILKNIQLLDYMFHKECIVNGELLF